MIRQARKALLAQRHPTCQNWFSVLSSTPSSCRYYSSSGFRDGTIKDHLSKEFQFLPGGPLPSYYFQKSLPLLPVPKLELSCQRYLEALRPLLNSDLYSRTEKIVADFQKGVGNSLHNELVQVNKGLKHTSYICAPWFEMYLKDRLPLPINVNPALVFVEDDDVMTKQPKNRRQLVRATNLLVSALRFMKSLDSEILEPEVFHLNPENLIRKITGKL